MKTEYLDQAIHKLDVMIATFGQAAVLSSLSTKEREALEHLKDARMALVEELEQRGETHS